MRGTISRGLLTWKQEMNNRLYFVQNVWSWVTVQKTMNDVILETRGLHRGKYQVTLQNL